MSRITTAGMNRLRFPTGAGTLLVTTSRSSLHITYSPTPSIPGALSQGQTSRSVKLTTRVHLVPQLKICGASNFPCLFQTYDIPKNPSTSSSSYFSFSFVPSIFSIIISSSSPSSPFLFLFAHLFLLSVLFLPSSPVTWPHNCALRVWERRIFTALWINTPCLVDFITFVPHVIPSFPLSLPSCISQRQCLFLCSYHSAVFPSTSILKLRCFSPLLLSSMFYFSPSVHTTLNLNLIAEFLTSLPVTPSNAVPCLQSFLLPPRIVFPVTTRPPRSSHWTLAALSLFRVCVCVCVSATYLTW